MDRASMDQLKHDTRLVGRRGWITKEDLQRELDALPDSADKAIPLKGSPSEDADPGLAADSQDS